MFCTVPPCPLRLPQPLLWPRRPGSAMGAMRVVVEGGSRRSGGGWQQAKWWWGTGANTGASGGAGASSGGVPASVGQRGHSNTDSFQMP